MSLIDTIRLVNKCTAPSISIISLLNYNNPIGSNSILRLRKVGERYGLWGKIGARSWARLGQGLDKKQGSGKVRAGKEDER